MAEWHSVLSYVYNGEWATGIANPEHPFYQPENPLGTANRTSAELLDNDFWLLENFDNYAALAGATFHGMVTLAVDPIAPLDAVTKQYADTKAKPLRFNFSTASDTWVCEHNLGRNVSVTAMDEDGNQIQGGVSVLDENRIQISFVTPIRGVVYIV